MTPVLAMAVDPWILAFSAITVGATIFMGFWSAKKSRTASDFFVAGRSVSVGWNASAISGEYLSAASFMGVAGMVMSSGYDALWYPVCYACGYLFLLLFIAGPLRRFGAYTIPDFAEGRYDSPLFRKIAVVFVLFIGFFYTMPQMKGAGTTLAYIFPGLPYWAGVVLVGAVITLNVALGGMKGITLVQAFQYWAKMFAISVPIFVLMAVYGHYGKQLGGNSTKSTELKTAQLDSSSSPIDPDFRTWDGTTIVMWSEFVRRGKLDNKNAPSGFVRLLPFGTNEPFGSEDLKSTAKRAFQRQRLSWSNQSTNINLFMMLDGYGTWAGSREIFMARDLASARFPSFGLTNLLRRSLLSEFRGIARTNGIYIVHDSAGAVWAVPTSKAIDLENRLFSNVATRKPLPEKAPKDEMWLSPFGPLTTKAAKTSATTPITNSQPASPRLKASVQADFVTVFQGPTELNRLKDEGKKLWHERVTKERGTGAGATFASETNSVHSLLNVYAQDQWCTVRRTADLPDTIVNVPTNSYPQGQFGEMIERVLATNGVILLHEANLVRAVPDTMIAARVTATVLSADQVRPYSLLYTYSLIIALVCGTAGLPHILVRFYTNPDGVAAKRTTMWVMILIGIFYVFPPVFGVMGRNLLPDLYAGVGAKGTDKIVLELPRILNERYAPLGSILSGITCAGAFAAFMSTFSGLLVSMTGALAHDVYGRMFRPKSSPEQRLRAFKVCTVLIGGIAIVLGCFVEPLEINFMVGQAFAIAAASYFPLLFMSVWWRGMTMRGAATGMLTGGLCALAAVTLTNVSNLALDKGPMGKIFAGFAPLSPFWAAHPLLRILCEQPAIWTVPLAIGLMIVIGKLTSRSVPPDTRMKMLVLHAPEKLGLKQEYIQEHQQAH